MDGASGPAGRDQETTATVQHVLEKVSALQVLLLRRRPPPGRVRLIPFVGSRSSREPLHTSEILRRLTWTLSTLTTCRACGRSGTEPPTPPPALHRLDSTLSAHLAVGDDGTIPAGPALNATLLQLQTELHCALLECADDSLLAFHLTGERGHDPGTDPAAGPTVDPADLALLLSADRGEGPATLAARRRAVLVLQHAAFREAHEELDRDSRNQVRAERQEWVGGYLLWLLVLALVVFVVTTSTVVDGPGWLQTAGRVLTSVAFAMLGGTISIVRELRSRENLSYGYKRAVSAQLLVSGVLGVLSLLLLEVGALPGFPAPGPGGALATAVVYAFLAGYSEPFVIGVVQSLTGAGNNPGASDRSLPGDRPT